MQAEDSSSATLTDRKRSASDWRTRIILGEQVGLTAFPEWLAHSYETLRAQVMDPAYPCFFGTMAERRGEMFYGYVSGKDTRTLPATMATFTRLASRPEYRKHNIAIFFEPDSEPLSHQAYHDLFWRTLQHLHDVDPDPQADAQPDPADETWEFSFGGVQMFVVCACPSFARRHSRNLGPGMVLLFQPRAVFVDTITNKVIGREARNQVRERLRDWDDVPPHPDLGFYGDPGNLEWKQYFLADENAPAADRCPFLKRMRRASGDTVDVTDAASSGARPAAPASPATNTSHGADLAALSRTYAALPAGRRAAFRERLGALGIAASRLPVLPLADRTHHFPLSFAQERLWFLWQLDPSDASYNIAAALRLEGQLAPSALRAAFDELVARHDILRTRFEAHDGHARQVVDVPHAAAYRWQTFSVSEERALQERLRALSHEPFDLTRGPLLRVSLLRIDERAHVLHIALHHIIADHASLKILLDEVAQAYPRHDADTAPLPALPALPALPVQYGDHAAWQREWAEDEAQARHLAYWVERLGGDPVSLMLPRLAHTAHANTGRGARTGKVLRGDVLRRLKHLAAGHRTTLFTTLLAAYAVLLGRYADQRDVRIGIPVSGRDRPETAALIGFFVDTLVVRAELPSGAASFETLLAQVHQRVVEAHEHQGVSFAKVVQALQPERAMGRTPLFDVVFNHTRAGAGSIALPGLRLSEYPFEAGSARFDLVLDVVERDDELKIAFNYAVDRFDEKTVARMLDCYVGVLSHIAMHADAPIGTITLGEGQPARASAEAKFEPVGRQLSRQAARHMQAPALHCEGRRLNHGELERWSNRIAHRLIDAGAGPDERIGLCIERSPALVAAVLGVLKSGAAFVPLDPSYPVDRLGDMLDDANATRLLVDAAGAARLGALGGGRACIDVGQLPPEDDACPDVAIHPEQLAYVIYTSGSTGRPKGVAITHRALSQHLRDFIDTYRITAADTQLQSSTLNFDVALHELLPALLCGGQIEMRGAALWDPQTTSRHLIDARVTFARIPTAYWQQWLRDPPPAHALSLRQITVGGEGLPGDALKQWYDGPLRHIRLDNLYGPTETTVACMYRPTTEADAGQAIVSIGVTYPSRSAHVLDRDGNEVPIGGIGELCIGGHTLARGYLGRPGLSAERFIPDPFDAAGARLYRTGDLCRRCGDGSIDFLGRLDQQIKLRGFRIELGEIEAALRDVPGVRAAAAAVHGEAHAKRLVGYVCGDLHDIDDAAIRRHLEKRLPVYMVPSQLMRIERLPIMPNGKIDRAALPVPDRNQASRSTMAPRTALERALLAIWQAVLERDDLGVSDHFFDAGGHSLLLMRVASRIRQTLGIDVSLQTLFRHPVLESLAAELAATESRAFGGIARRDPRNPRQRIPLSYEQERLWFLWKLDPDSPAYTIARAVGMRGALDVRAVRRALEQLVARHEILRTRFEEEDGGAFQVVDPEPRYEWIEETAADAGQVEARLRELARAPFNLAQGPVLRAALLRVGPQDFAFLLAMPHIVSDAWSQAILLREFAQYYRAACDTNAGDSGEPAALPIQYGDYATWQRAGGQADEHAQDEAYWLAELAGEQPRLALPVDRVRVGARSGEGAWVRRRLDASLVRALEQRSRQHDATRFTTMLAAYGALLRAYCAQDDIRIGVPVAGRHHMETESLIGFFVNTLVIRMPTGHGQPFGAILAAVRERVLAAHAHARLPFARLVERLHPRRSLDETPLFQTMFNYSDQHRATLALPGVEIRPLGAATGAAQFDLALDVSGSGDKVNVALNYAADIFDRETAERLLDGYVHLLHQVADAIDTRDLVPQTPAQRFEVLGWGRCDAALGEPVPVHVLIDRQARRTPDAVAVVCGETSMRYGALNAQANRLAHWLRRAGVGPDVCVGIALERSVHMVTALLGVLKAGGAYVPLDPSYPAQRLSHMLSDSGAKLVLTQSHALDGVSVPAGTQVVALDALDVSNESAHDPQVALDAEHLAYVIYTSGSTGLPKGVMVRHGALSHFLQGMQQRPGIAANDVLVAVTSLSFDIAALELYLPLMAGARLVVAPRDVARDGAALAALLAYTGASVMQSTPATWRMLLDAHWQGGKLKALCGGEALSAELAAELRARGVTLWNLYGPTETTIWSSLQRVDAAPRLGRPVPGTQLYVLDASLNPSPVGAAGELYIGGAGLARGYLNRAGLTAERFVPDPFDGGGARLYRTGDLARWHRDGALDYLGRIDHQVKIRGFRIELGEIEAQLLSQPGVREAVVVARPGPSGARLLGYVTAQPAHEQTAQALRASLGETLPAYMVPSALVVLDALPLTPNGKVDRNALPEPAYEAAGYEAPAGEVETALARIWGEVLGVERVGRHDNFFELGGDSILSLKVVARLRDAGFHAAPRMLFERQTVAALAAVFAHAEVDDAGIASTVDFPLDAADPATLDRLPWPRADIQDVYPATPVQTGLLFHSLRETGQGVYVNQRHYTLRGPIDRAALRRTWETLIARHDILRTGFSWAHGDDVLQGVRKHVATPWHEHDWAAMAPSDYDARLAAWLRDDLAQGFDLTHGPLLRIHLFMRPDGQHDLVWTDHHVLMDGWSTGQLLGEMLHLYHAATTGGTARLPAPVPYRRYVEWLHGQPDARPWWQAQIARINDPATLGASLPVPAATATPDPQPVSQLDDRFEREATRRLRQAARRYRVTLHTLLQAAWAILLARYGNREQVAFGVTVSGREHGVRGAERMLGLFINSLPLWVDVPAHAALGAWLQALQRHNSELRVHEAVPLSAVQAWSGRRGDALFDSLFVFENYPIDAALRRGRTALTVTAKTTRERTHYPMVLAVVPGDQLSVRWKYRGERFDDATVRRLATSYRDILEQIAGAACPHVGDVVAAPRAVAEGVRASDASIIARAFHPVAARIRAQALRHPGREAVHCEGRRLTYGELDTLANRLGHRLRQLGVRPDERVGLCITRSAELVAGILGIWKAGAAFVPLDPAYPAERLAAMLDDACVTHVVADAAGWAQLAAISPVYRPGCRPVMLEALDGESAAPCDIPVHPAQLAYVIYTSGSTGKPKGVAISHGALCHHLDDFIATYRISASDRQLQSSTINFDVSLHEMLPALCEGGSIEMRGPRQWDLQTTSRHLSDARVTFARIPTAYWQQWLRTPPPASALAALRQITVGGEALPGDALARWQAGPLAHIRLDNLYGPTETTIACMYRATTAEDAGSAVVSIGQTYASRHAYVLDPAGHEAPIDGIGELCIGGATLARGYLGRAGLTAEKFIPDPFANDGSRLYRTGDLCRRRPDGRIDFLGRLDHQVKLRGLRIETGEIEAVLRQTAGVREAVVVLQGDGETQQLVAYVVGDAVFDALRRSLDERLPAYMVPAAFIRLDALPMMPNGKTDRAALPVPQHSDAQCVAARTPSEHTLLAILRDVLHRDDIGVTDDFFAAGGHSLLALKVLARAAHAGLPGLTLEALFQYPTARLLAARLDADESGAAEPAAVTGNIVRMNRIVEGENLFAIHPASGLVADYRPLAAALDGVVTVHGVQAPFYTEAWWVDDIAELAADYAARIRTIQPSGPYRLIGWSIGGVVATEVARTLVRDGHAVTFVGLIDAHVLDASDGRDAEAVTRAQVHTYRASNDELQAAMDGVARKWPGFAGELDDPDTRSLLSKVVLFERHLGHIVRRAERSPLPLELKLWWATHEPYRPLGDATEMWSARTGGRVSVQREIGTDHRQIVRHPALFEDLARAVAASANLSTEPCA